MVVVDLRHEIRIARHQLRDEELARHVDGGRRVAAPGTERVQEPLGEASPVRVEPDRVTEERGNRVRCSGAADLAETRRQVVEAFLPGDRLESSVAPQHRMIEPTRVVVPGGQGAALRAGVPASELVVGIAAHADHSLAGGAVAVVVALDGHDDPAERRAEAAEGVDLA